MKSDIERELIRQVKAAGLPDPWLEYMFARDIGRRWRFDLCWVERKIAVEVDGGSWIGGRHTRGAGFEADCEKLSTAAELGYLVFRYTAKHINNGYALEQLERVLRGVAA